MRGWGGGDCVHRSSNLKKIVCGAMFLPPPIQENNGSSFTVRLYISLDCNMLCRKLSTADIY